MTEDMIRYDILVQNALRGVIRKVLTEVAKTGLPGNHHFFITFVTGAPGVKVSNRMREQYPEQMTIVLQHQFWDLDVTENAFSVGLSFSDVPEKLYVPYSAIRGFYDPSVNFELEFDVENADAAGDENTDQPLEPAAGKGPATLPAAGAPRKKPDEDGPDGGEGGGADVVSLDSFRKNK
ncbi:SspB family protein [Oricola sp.]|uniref:SspB family protein n=1 Tax=Oricola sp. TaxID=1979950 RepID=UPI0025DF627A|nr:SspB family protein [Oricola sp.]MCI5075720.1 SspB family protein [Oricola sp.]